MKKIFTYCIILLILTALNLPAQNFKASEGLTKAQATTTLPSPELWGIGTIDTTINGIAIKFDMTTGKSNAWLYFFHSKTTDEIKICGVTYLFGTQIGLEVPTTPSYDNFPYKPSKTLDGLTWIDSDVMANDLTNSTEYQQFVIDHPNIGPSLVVLGVNANAPGLTVDSPYWMFKFDIDTAHVYFCAVDAVSGEVTCFTPTDVAEDMNGTQSSLFIYPNPSGERAFLRIPANIQSPQAQLAIYDVEGNKIRDLNAPHNGEAELVVMPLCDYTPGVYFIKYTIKDKTYTNQLVIQR